MTRAKRTVGGGFSVFVLVFTSQSYLVSSVKSLKTDMARLAPFGGTGGDVEERLFAYLGPR